jgi:glycosyltransferase involved in cell wall biosynthesis
MDGVDGQPELSMTAVETTANDDVLVVVPMYNEASVIGDVVRELREVFPHVVCIDDGSRDDSAALAAAAGAHVLVHPTNLGQGAALQTGIAYGLTSTASYFVTYDADGQHEIAGALRMLAVAREGATDIVLGSRFLEPSGTAVPALRRLVLRGGVAFTQLTTGLKLTDTHNGLRVLTRSTARVLNLRLPGMAHASEILEAVSRHGLRYVEVPMTVRYTDYSRAKGQSSVNALNIVFDLLLARVRWAR